MRATHAEIDLDAIRHNLQEIRRLTHPDAFIMAVVKANAYGHGVMEVVNVALACGITHFAVGIPEEGIYLRKHGITEPIFILGLTLPGQAEEIVQYDLCPNVATWESMSALSQAATKLGKQVKVSIKLDTGMHRIGIPVDEAVDFIKRSAALDGIILEGLISHLSAADMADKTYTNSQFNAFLSVCTALEQNGIHIPLKSLANSAAALDLQHMHFDIVRPGITIYGLAPSDEVTNRFNLIPAMQFKTRVIYLKKVPSDRKIGYSCTYTTQRETTIATLPVGYADGYNRLLSNRGEVLIAGQRCPVIGRVCMDQIMVDVTHLPEVKIGDEVVLFGKQGHNEITIDEFAQKIGTISYEVICAISARVPRVYLNR